MLRQDFRHESQAVFQALVTKNGRKNGYCFQDEYALIFGYAISRSRIWLYIITVEKLAISHCGQKFGYANLFAGGDYGLFNSDLCMLYMRAAAVCAENGDKTQSLAYFDATFTHQIAFKESWDRKENKPTSPILCSAVELPRRFFVFENSTYRERVAALPEDVANAIRANPKYASLFME